MASLGYSYRRLVNLLGPERVARGEMERLVYSHDLAAVPKPAYLNFRLVPDFVVLPKTTKEVSRIVEFSIESVLPIVPRGGGTGFYGGAVANRGGILVDFRLMRAIGTPDPETRTITTQPGATWQDLYDAAWRAGAYVPYQPHLALSSTVGGYLNSGGVGIGAMKYGGVRENLLGCEMVLEDGSVVRSGSDQLDLGTRFGNLGPFLAGSEGTIALVTSATLRTYPQPEEIRPLGYAFPDVHTARKAMEEITRQDIRPLHAEIMDEQHLEYLRAIGAQDHGKGAVLSVGLDGPKEEVAIEAESMDAIAASMRSRKLPDAQAAEAWRARHYQYPARRLGGGMVIAEAILPLYRLGDAIDGVRAITDKLKMQTAMHISLLDHGSCVVRPYFLIDETAPFMPMRLAFVKRFADLALNLRGHPLGSGLYMVFNLRKMHGYNARKMKYLKAALDERQGLNPGKTVEMWAAQDVPIFGPVRLPAELMRAGLGALGGLRRLGFRDDYSRSVSKED